MSDRVNIKADESARERLKEHKREGENWTGLLLRAADALDADAEGQYPAPRCTSCGVKANEWTVEDGELRCPDCAESDVEVEIKKAESSSQGNKQIDGGD